MTPRQKDLLANHRSLAFSGTNADNPVFVILDLEDSAGLQIATSFQSDCAEQRDRIRESGAYPALTLAMSVKGANDFISRGWPTMKRIEEIPDQMVFVILVSEERCLAMLLPRDQQTQPSGILKPDFGTKLAASGFNRDKSVTFFDVPVTEITFIQRGKHTILFEYPHEGTDYAVSLDFGMDILNVILGRLSPDELHSVLNRSVESVPFVMSLPRPIILTCVECRLGEMQSSVHESFLPFLA
jgi:hypothetical protein